MQPILEKILSNTLSNEEKLKAFFMNDEEKSYYIYAWILNNNVIDLGYGKEDTYLQRRPIVDITDKTSQLFHVFPYEQLTEKEAYILSIYEKHKFQKLGYKNINDFGLFTEEL